MLDGVDNLKISIGENHTNLYNMKEFFSKNLKVILIVILLLFGMQKCTQSCNRQGKIVVLTERVQYLDSVIDVRNHTITLLERDTMDYLNQIKMYQKFDARRSVTDSINEVNLKKQREQTDELVRQQRNLINSIKKNGKEN